MPTFIYLISHESNKSVGLLETIQGVAQLVVAIPAGLLADGWRRDGVLRMSSAATFAAIAMILFAVWHPDRLEWLALGMGAWGMASALSDGPMEALFADSTPTGNRSKIYSINYALMMAGGSSGGLVGAFIFWCTNNSWTIFHLQVVISAGMLLAIVPAVLQAFMNDGFALSRIQAEAAPLLIDEDLESIQVWTDAEKRQLSWVPYLLTFCDVLTALGAGATIKFFGLYFANEFNMRPFSVAMLLASTPLVISIVSIIAADHAHRFGRVRTILFYHLVGTLLLFLFAIESSLAASIPIFVARGAVMNSFKPLKRSLLMDVVEKKRRGCWNSIESLTRFSWSGSAALGGIAVDQWGYRSTFFITACLYVVASIPLFALYISNIESKLNTSRPESS